METNINWIGDILDKLNNDWKDNLDLNYAIFQSPVTINPILLIIGDNPGGNEKIRQTKPPENHEYFTYDYTLAKKMKDLIFEGDKMNKILFESVKINRIFFKSRKLADFKRLKNHIVLEKYCWEMVKLIIEKINPKYIFAETFGTFRKLCSEENVLLKKKLGKKLLLEGYYNDIQTYGINHPSRAGLHKITNDDWQLVNKKLQILIS